MKYCPKCQRALIPERISPSDLIQAAASMSPPMSLPVNVQVIEAAFLLSCMVDVEITRLARSPADRDRMLALVQQHIEQRMEAKT